MLVLGPLRESEVEEAVLLGVDIVLWREELVGCDRAARRRDRHAAVARVHVKLDTGMGRLGVRDPEQASRAGRRRAAAPTSSWSG